MAAPQEFPSWTEVTAQTKNRSSLRIKLFILFCLGAALQYVLLSQTLLPGRVILFSIILTVAVLALAAWVVTRHFVQPLVRWAGDAQKAEAGQGTPLMAVPSTNADRDFALTFNSLLNQSERKQQLLQSQLDEAEKQLRAARLEYQVAQASMHVFLTEIGDEIRDPLNAVIGLSHLCMQTQLSIRQRDYLQKIHRSGELSLCLLNDTYDFVQIQNDALSLDKLSFSMEEVLLNLANRTHQRVVKKELEYLFNVQANLPLKFNGDAFRLEQIIFNLLSKIIQLSDEFATVELLLQHQRQENRSALLHVEVRGSAIYLNDQQQAALLSALVTTDSLAAIPCQAAQLGLAVASNLIRLMGGNLGAVSDGESGLIFYFDLLLPIDEDAPQIALGAGLNHARVLLVDDHATARQVLTESLQQLLCDVDAVDSGPAALELLHSRHAAQAYDLLMIDRQMPDMNGLDLIRKIKADKRISPEPKIILLTPFGREELQLKAERLGIQAVLQKPVNQPVLLDTVFKVFCGENTFVSGRYGTSPYRQYPGVKILLIEANEIDQQIVVDLLKLHGISVTVAVDEAQAHDILLNTLEGRYSLALFALPLDYELADLSELYASLQLPVVAMVAHVEAFAYHHFRAHGLQDCFSKPVQSEKLAKLLLRWLGPGLPAAANNKIMNPEPLANSVKKEKSPDLSGDGNMYALPGASLSVASNANEGPGSVHIPDLQEIELAQGVRMMGGRLPLYLKTLKKFAATQASVVADLHEMIADLRYAQAGRMAHSLKVLASTIAAPKVEMAAYQLEADLHVPEVVSEDINSDMLALERAMTPLLAELRRKLGPSLSAGSNPANSGLY